MTWWDRRRALHVPANLVSACDAAETEREAVHGHHALGLLRVVR